MAPQPAKMLSPRTPSLVTKSFADYHIYHYLSIGLLLTAVFYGIILKQTLTYYTTYRADKLRVKVLVGVLLLLSTFTLVLEVIPLQITLIERGGDLSALNGGSWGVATVPVATGLVVLLVQLFFAHRIRILSKTTWIAAIIGIIAVLQFGFSVLTTVSLLIVQQFLRYGLVEPVAICWIALGLLGDAMIAITLVSFLLRHRTGVLSADSTANKIIRMTIQTGFVTFVAETAGLCLYLTDPSSGRYLLVGHPIHGIYIISLLSSLLARKAWRQSWTPSNLESVKVIDDLNLSVPSPVIPTRPPRGKLIKKRAGSTASRYGDSEYSFSRRSSVMSNYTHTQHSGETLVDRTFVPSVSDRTFADRRNSTAGSEMSRTRRKSLTEEQLSISISMDALHPPTAERDSPDSVPREMPRLETIEDDAHSEIEWGTAEPLPPKVLYHYRRRDNSVSSKDRRRSLSF
ncbi:hypothetical protein PLICRDRAFT_93395 [Plicaturopsis crispa FD-325 SS-3]|nr:hypothetical protein PLICRDRAFT_93395 [Plicaturopsis crispa FD-325 SS-3]